ncbi:MAG: hypothetical protein WD670_02845, partial [Actinomycetota bacterium]
MSASATRPARWPWLALALFFGLAIAGTAGVVANDESLAEQVLFLIAFSMFGVVGALLLSRASGNRIGGLLLYCFCAVPVAFGSGELTTFLATRGSTEGAMVVAAAVLSEVGWVFGIVPVLILLPLLFPDGRLPSPRWRPLVWATVTFLAFLGVAVIFGSDVLTGSVEEVKIANPLFVPALEELFAVSDAVINAVLLGLLVASFASIVVRFRRARGIERQQIKWVALAVSFLVASFVISEVLFQLGVESGLVDSLIIGPAFLALPV